MYTPVLQDMRPCSLIDVKGYEKLVSYFTVDSELFFKYPEDGGSNLLRSASTYAPIYTVSYSIWLESLSTFFSESSDLAIFLTLNFPYTQFPYTQFTLKTEITFQSRAGQIFLHCVWVERPVEIFALTRCYVAYIGSKLPTFQVSSSAFEDGTDNFSRNVAN